MTKKISQLPAATSVDTNDEFVINQDGTTKKLTTANQWDFDNVNIDGGTIDGTAVNATNLAYTGTLTGGTGVVNLGSGQVVKDAAGNVGIGTTAPNTKLYVASSAAASVPSAGGASSHLAVGETDYGTMIGTLGTGDGYIQQQRFNGVADTFNLLLQPNGGHVNLTGGGNLILSNGAGIDFSAHPNAAGMTSELLDDYEEGTWTIALVPSTSGTVTFDSLRAGAYTKVGRMVTITGFINVGSVASPVGAYLRLTGLPFAIADLTDQAARFGGALTYFDGVSDSAVPVLGLENESEIRVMVNVALVAAGHSFSFCFSYMTA